MCTTVEVLYEVALPGEEVAVAEAPAQEAREWQELPSNEAEQSYQEWAAKLTDVERRAVRVYTGQQYKEINGALRAKKFPGRIKETIAYIDSALAKASLDRDTITYRGASLLDVLKVSEIKDPAKLVGREIHDLGFLSTSRDKDLAQTWANAHQVAFWEVRIPKGTKGAFVAPTAYQEKEQEVLLARGQKLRIIEANIDRKGKGTIVVEVIK